MPGSGGRQKRAAPARHREAPAEEFTPGGQENSRHHAQLYRFDPGALPFAQPHRDIKTEGEGRKRKGDLFDEISKLL